MRLLLLLLVTAPALAAPPELPAVVDRVEIQGLWRSEPHVVLRELQFTDGAEISPEQWDLAVTRLWNTGLFSQVRARLEARDVRTFAVIEVEERFTINPLFKFSTAGSDYWLRAGVSDSNFLGRFLELGAQYERFGDYHGGQAWVRDPRLFDRRLNGLVQVERLARPRPGFVVFRSLARLEAQGFADAEDKLSVLGRIDLLSDTFDADRPTSQGVLATAGVRLGRVDTIRLRQQGWSLELRPTLGVVTEGTFAQLWLEGLAFAMPGNRWTLAARVQAGASTAAPEQHRFYVGGLDLVRGLPDNHVRTHAFAVANLEARFIAWDSTWLAIVPAAFVDGVLAAGESGETRALVSTGFGVRLLVPRLVNTGLRADVAVALGGVQPSFGVFQFF